GERRLSVAYAEEQARFDLDDVVTRITPQDDGYRISGRKSMVFHAQGSDYLVVSGRSYGGQTDRDGITLLLVDAASEGVRMTSFPTVDGLRASEIEFEDVFVPKAHLLGAEGGGYSLLESIAIDGILALSAEAVGAMEVLY
ncbi:MAG TPA: hypothetical protein DCP57_01600, partial [Gammaproteobacteria bacterium]|nr:hypothetical protein [Gammaproteobacteria bacterium]